MFSLSEKSKKIIEQITGKKITELSNTDDINKELYFSKNVDNRKLGRGNPLLSRGRIKTLKEVDQKISEL